METKLMIKLLALFALAGLVSLIAGLVTLRMGAHLELSMSIMFLLWAGAFVAIGGISLQ